MQEKITLLAKSSDGFSHYEVEFIRENGLLKAFCECGAGILGKFCRHKWGFLEGNKKLLFDSAQEAQLSSVAVWATESSFENLYDDVNEIEEMISTLQQAKKQAKAIVEKKLREGF